MIDPPQNDELEDKLPERPLECHECKKAISVRYTEIVGDHFINLCMCKDCPELLKRLKGSSFQTSPFEEGGASLACGDCGTTLEALKVGQPLGCSHCYVVFEDPLLLELRSIGKIPLKINAQAQRRTSVHMGRMPGVVQEMNPSLRILALNEALSETLKREDYEQAAWIRDQIKALTEEHPESKNE